MGIVTSLMKSRARNLINLNRDVEMNGVELNREWILRHRRIYNRIDCFHKISKLRLTQ